MQLDLTCNCIGADGALALGYALGRCESLRSLILRQNLISNVGCGSVCHALCTSNKTLTELNMAACGLTVDSARFISRVIADNASLKELDISCNDFGEVG